MLAILMPLCIFLYTRAVAWPDFGTGVGLLTCNTIRSLFVHLHLSRLFRCCTMRPVRAQAASRCYILPAMAEHSIPVALTAWVGA